MTTLAAEPAFEVSLILVLPDETARAEASLQHLCRYTTDVDLELFVVDDGRGAPPDLLHALEGDVRVVRHDSPLGTVASWNEAARAARGRYLVFLDPELLPTHDWLGALVRDARGRVDVGAVSPRVLGPDGSERALGRGFASEVGVARAFAELDGVVVTRMDRRALPALGDGCLLAPAEAFATVEGFDERLDARAAVLDYCLRVHARGLAVDHQPASVLVSQARGDELAARRADPSVLRRRWGVTLATSPDALWVEGRSVGRGPLPPPGAAGHFCDDPARRPPHFVDVGQGTYFVSGTRFLTWTAEERIRVGRYCSIATGVTIFAGGGHSLDTVSSYPFEAKLFNASNPTRSLRTTRDTVIGNDVWIGDGAVVSGGVHIGDGAVIGTSAVVFNDIPPYAIAVGNPAKVLRYRFSRSTVEALQRIAWWDWTEDEVRERVEWFFRPLPDFIARFDPMGETDAAIARIA